MQDITQKPIETNLAIIRGDDKYYQFEFKDNDGIALDINGWTIYFTAKANLGDSDEDAIIAVDTDTPTGTTDGKILIHLGNEDTDVPGGNYWYDVQVKKANGESVSKISVKKQIEILIKNEDKSNPLSDKAIQEALAVNEGIMIKRRTIAKYRDSLKILPTYLRRQR